MRLGCDLDTKTPQKQEEIIRKTAKIIANQNTAMGKRAVPAATKVYPRDVNAEMLDQIVKMFKKKNRAADADEGKEEKVAADPEDKLEDAADADAENEVEEQVKAAKKQGEKLAKTSKLTKSVFATLDGNVRSEWKKRLKAFFSESNVNSFDSIPVTFLSGFNQLVKDIKLDNEDFMTALETLIDQNKPEVVRVNNEIDRSESDLAEAVDAVTQRNARAKEQAKETKAAPKTKAVKHDEETIVITDKPIKAKCKKVKHVDDLLK